MDLQMYALFVNPSEILCENCISLNMLIILSISIWGLVMFKVNKEWQFTISSFFMHIIDFTLQIFTLDIVNNLYVNIFLCFYTGAYQ